MIQPYQPASSGTQRRRGAGPRSTIGQTFPPITQAAGADSRRRPFFGGLCCVVCGSDELFAIRPGHDRIAAAIAAAEHAGDRVVQLPTAPDVPTVAWCLGCWPWGLVARARQDG